MAPPQPDEQPPREPWHAATAAEVAQKLEVDPQRGLDAAEAAARLERFGPNRIEVEKGPGLVRLLARQYADVLIAVLAVAAAVSLALGETLDALAILAILVLNGALGFVQEWRAEQAIQALQKMLAPHCEALRDGRSQRLEAAELVPGDVVLLATGARVPADLRLLETRELRVDQSALTGESESVSKGTEPCDADTPLAERDAMVFMGTTVNHGRGRGLVVATGARSEFGRIAELTHGLAETRTPLQQQLAGLGRQLGAVAVGISVLVAGAGWLLGRPLYDMFMTGVSLAVAVVPEGLPAVVTITLAVGIRAMVRRRALLRRLPAAETLGAATVICTDKTGTLTRNEMTVRRVWLAAGELEVTGTGYEPEGRFESDGSAVDPGSREDLRALLATGAICNDAHVEEGERGWRAVGEPTEASLVVAALKAGIEAPDGEPVAELPFDSTRKRMTVVTGDDAERTAHVKGAPDVILPRCTGLLEGDAERDLGDAERERVKEAYERLAGDGLRVLALARRALPGAAELDAESLESELVLLGLVGILDPPRPEVPEAVARARSAGIRVVMITGDAAPTALAIARRIELPAERAVSGAELERMDDAELSRLLEDDVVFARTTPEHKLRIVERLRAEGHVAAMTGDGVNDAPALRRADIGIAMGVRGTDVARAASDMVLTDDNFASIVGAVEEGRRQYDNIVKFVGNLVSSNLGEVCAIFGNILLGGPLILLPVQILWVNLVTDGLTSIALGVEPVEPGVMDRPPRRRGAAVIGRGRTLALALMGLYVGVAALWLYEQSHGSDDLERARTLAFTALIALEIANSLNFRTLATPLYAVRPLGNPWLLLAMAGSLGLHVLAMHVPFLQQALHLVPLRLEDWARIAGLALPLWLASEVVKTVRWRRRTAG